MAQPSADAVVSWPARKKVTYWTIRCVVLRTPDCTMTPRMLLSGAAFSRRRSSVGTLFVLQLGFPKPVELCSRQR